MENLRNAKVFSILSSLLYVFSSILQSIYDFQKQALLELEALGIPLGGCSAGILSCPQVLGYRTLRQAILN